MLHHLQCNIVISRHITHWNLSNDFYCLSQWLFSRNILIGWMVQTRSGVNYIEKSFRKRFIMWLISKFIFIVPPHGAWSAMKILFKPVCKLRVNHISNKVTLFEKAHFISILRRIIKIYWQSYLHFLPANE